jgi:hypothetical protein
MPVVCILASVLPLLAPRPDTAPLPKLASFGKIPQHHASHLPASRVPPQKLTSEPTLSIPYATCPQTLHKSAQSPSAFICVYLRPIPSLTHPLKKPTNEPTLAFPYTGCAQPPFASIRVHLRPIPSPSSLIQHHQQLNIRLHKLPRHIRPYPPRRHNMVPARTLLAHLEILRLDRCRYRPRRHR